MHRLRPFIDAANPGHPNDPETKAFEAQMRKEAEDLKFESFGVEVRLTYPVLSSSFQPARSFYIR